MLSAAVLAPSALFCLWWGGVFWALLVLVASVLMAQEWARMAGRSILGGEGLGFGAVILVASITAALGYAGAALVLLALGAVAVRRQGSLPYGMLAVGGMCVALLWLRRDGQVGLHNLLFLIAVVWASDIGAYAVGRWLGGPRLAPSISPGKTWSGSVGGLAIAAAIGAALAHGLAGGSMIVAALLALALAAASQVGDLMESALKRHAGVKDSGALIPGHGGLLDRVDGFLTAGPLMAVFALWAGRGMEVWR